MSKQQVAVRLNDAEIDLLDKYADAHEVSRSEAARRIIVQAISGEITEDRPTIKEEKKTGVREVVIQFQRDYSYFVTGGKYKGIAIDNDTVIVWMAGMWKQVNLREAGAMIV